MNAPELTIERTEAGAVLRFAGDLTVAALDLAMRRAEDARDVSGAVAIDLADVAAFDTGGAWLVTDLRARLEASGAEVEVRAGGPERALLIDTVARSLPGEHSEEAPPTGIVPWVEGIGRGTAGAVDGLGDLLSFFGLTLARIARTLVQPRRLRFTSLVHHMQVSGFDAVPIVALMAFLIGVVLAFQGSAQLRQFGAEVFVVDLIAISILRELGILMTAILVAGRSGSAYTAAIGSMKVREEIDAMRTLGLDPTEVLVLPRVLALLIMLPVLGFIANMAGLFGGALMAWIELGVSPGMFITRLQDNTDIWHLAIGMIKAPFFAVIIGVVGCHQGMAVKGSAEDVGRRTTSSVVIATFLVIVVDALFSIFFSEMGL